MIGGDAIGSKKKKLTLARVACHERHTPLSNSRASGPLHSRGTLVNTLAQRFLPVVAHCSGSTERGVHRAGCG